MLNYLVELPEPVGFGILFVALALAGFLGWRSADFVSRMSHKREKRKIEYDNQNIQKSMKQLWDDEKEKMKLEIQSLENELEQQIHRVEEYRKKLAGMGSLNFFSKKRSDILYSLLLENETLEQLLGQQTQKVNDQNEVHLKEKLIDIRKRQRLMSEIFNNETIKGFVKEIIEEKGLTAEEDGQVSQKKLTEKIKDINLIK